MTDNFSEDPVKIVAFDFDGTITTKDTFALFLKYWAGTPRWAFNILKLLPIFIAYSLKFINRDSVKIHVCRMFFKGADSKRLNEVAAQFAKDVIPDLIRPAALERFLQRNSAPYTLYIVSASIEPYLKAWAKCHSVENILSTKLDVVNGQLTGELDGINCWGAGKTAKIAAEMSETPYEIVEAYGDSRGDQEMLHAAKVSYWQPFRL